MVINVEDPHLIFRSHEEDVIATLVSLDQEALKPFQLGYARLVRPTKKTVANC